MRFPLMPRFRFALACLALLTGLSAASTTAQAAPSFSTGVMDSDAFQFDQRLPFQRTEAAGAKYVKNNLYWDFIVSNAEVNERPGTPEEPFNATDPSSSYYDWDASDRLIRHAAAVGLTPLLTIAHSPKWARAGACRDEFICTPNPKDFADFATAAAKRYNGNFDPKDGKGVLPRVAHWQAWGEANLSLFYSPIFRNNGSPLAPYKYRNILNAFYNAIHNVNDSNVVISAGLAPNAVKDRAIAPLDFTRRALCMKGNFKNPKPKPGCGKTVKADVWAVHPYTTGSPAHLPSNGNNMSVGALPRMTKLIRAANRAGKLRSNRGRTRVWATEFSWDSRPDPGGLSWNEQTRWVAEAMYLMFKAKVDTMIWFGLRDVERDGRPWSETFQSGLYLRGNSFENDKPKKVLQAFRHPFYAELAGRKGFRFWGRTPDSKSGQVKIFARRKGNGGFAKVGVTKANGNGIYSGFIRKRGFTKKSAIRSRVRGGSYSVPFGLYRTKDRFQPPFG